MLLIKHNLGMFWSITSSFVQNKNATAWRMILFGEQSSEAALSFYNHTSCPLLLGPAGSTLLRREGQQILLCPQAETQTGQEESSVGEKATMKEKIKEERVMRYGSEYICERGSRACNAARHDH